MLTMRSKFLLSLEPILSLSDETQIPASALRSGIGAAAGQQAHLSKRECIRTGIGRILGSNNANFWKSFTGDGMVPS